jgi:NADH-quinone oxidoreductase subunit H
MIVDILLYILRVVFMLFIVLNFTGLLTWVERKQSALMQDRIGPNRASIFGLRLFGLFHPLADLFKLFSKEDFIPDRADKFLFNLAPFVSLFFAFSAFAVIPYGPTVTIAGRPFPLQAAGLNVGVLFVFAALSLGIYGVVFAGWGSRNSYALLGGQRAAALMLSYEITIGISIMGLLMVFRTLDLARIVEAQGELLWGAIPRWGVIVQPLGFLLFMVAGIAATKRIPFDTPEGESEIIGYFLEYSGMKFGMMFMADFVETVVIAGMTTTLFLGGWQFPYLGADGFHFPGGAFVGVPHPLVATIQILSFLAKMSIICWFMMLVRWTLPRYRYDHAMRLGWLGLLPLSMVNILITGLVLVIVEV